MEEVQEEGEGVVEGAARLSPALQGQKEVEEAGVGVLKEPKKNAWGVGVDGSGLCLAVEEVVVPLHLVWKEVGVGELLWVLWRGVVEGALLCPWPGEGVVVLNCVEGEGEGGFL